MEQAAEVAKSQEKQLEKLYKWLSTITIRSFYGGA
jgi:hypothetical protein